MKPLPLLELMSSDQANDLEARSIHNPVTDLFCWVYKGLIPEATIGIEPTNEGFAA